MSSEARPTVKEPRFGRTISRLACGCGPSLACPIRLIPSAQRAHPGSPFPDPCPQAALGLPHWAHSSAELIRRPAGHVELTRGAGSCCSSSPPLAFPPFLLPFASPSPLRSPARTGQIFMSAAASEPSLPALVFVLAVAVASAKRWS